VRIRRHLRVFSVAALALLISGCVQSHFRMKEALERPTHREARILVLPADVELFELSFGGAPVPRQDWTVAARQNMDMALKAHFGDRNIAVTFSDVDIDDEEVAKLMRLHAVVGRSIKVHQYDGPEQLPTKKNTFDWSMGPEIRRLADKDAADYVLFVHVRDSYSGGGRVAAQVVAAVLFGVALPGGVQDGFASVVDLNTGNFIWFNRLIRGSGDLRTESPARETVPILLQGMPQ
jgi:hypothetical protein